ncbi:MAG: alpha/beta fold hydrolase [Sphingomonadaceae bacterium]|nr:alpha/beta fold hydrolase [Sphingomonadaceae bacterium]
MSLVANTLVSTERIGPAPSLCVDRAGDGQLLLFLHGIGGNRGNWTAQLCHFGRRFTAVAWDARGYGDSDDYDDALAMADFSDDVIRVADHYGARRIHLVGLSMGGRIALDSWRRFPDRIASLTLADTSAGSKETQAPGKVEVFLAARRAPLLAGQTPAELAPVLVEQIIGPNIGAVQKTHLTDSLAALHSASYLKTLEMVTRFTDFPDFATIDVPTLVIVGSEDRVAPPQVARAMTDAIPGARLEVIDGAGHISNVEAPDEFNRVLDHFLANAE